MKFSLDMSNKSYHYVTLEDARGPRDLLTENPGGWVEADDGVLVNLAQVNAIYIVGER